MHQKNFFSNAFLDKKTPVAKKYNQILRNIKYEFLGKGFMRNFVRKEDLQIQRNNDITWTKEKDILFDFYKMTDENICEPFRKTDRSVGAKNFLNNVQQSYVAVINRYVGYESKLFKYPYECCDKNNKEYVGILDPRIEVVARSYEGPIAEIAQAKKQIVQRDLRKDYIVISSNYEPLEFGCCEADRTLQENAAKDFVPKAYNEWKERAGINNYDKINAPYENCLTYFSTY